VEGEPVPVVVPAQLSGVFFPRHDVFCESNQVHQKSDVLSEFVSKLPRSLARLRRRPKRIVYLPRGVFNPLEKLDFRTKPWSSSASALSSGGGL
jgi:hypothetical protein